MPKLIRITTAPLSMKYLLTGQMRYMQQHGFDVTMVSSEGKEWPDIIKNEECDHCIIHMTRKMTPFTDLVSLWKLYRYFKIRQPDIVHSHTPKAGLLAMLAAKFAGIKIRIHTIAGLRFMTSTGIGRKILIQMEKLTARSATHVWPNSFSLLNYIKKNNLVKENKMEVIGLGSSNGIDLSRFSISALNNEKLQRVKEKIKYDTQLVYLLCVGRIVRDKGIDELVKSFNKVYANNKNLRLILVGEFEDEVDPVSDEVRMILKKHPGIIMTGWSDEVEYYMHLSYALIHPSYREGFPNVLLQAGAMQCPVICSRIEGNIDIVDHQETGLIFEVKDENDLQQKLEWGLTNKETLKAYAQTLRFKIEQYFDQPVLHSLIRKKYAELLVGSPFPSDNRKTTNVA
ncbi:MAG: glycosyltransferase family 4 protein [Bacteroidetes bacterium]|nr:glycosyltransferase family 4 protein [Bacteroidota bacterium]